MASQELVVLIEGTPQVRAPVAADTGVVPNLSVTTNAAVGGTLGVTGATTLSSTLGVTGAITNTAGTANGVAYLNGSKVVTSSASIQFDGTNLGVGSTPSAISSSPSIQISSGGFVYGNTALNMGVGTNAYNDGSWRYKATGFSLLQTSDGNNGSYQWNTAPSGTAGNAITFTSRMTLSEAGNLTITTGDLIITAPTTPASAAASGTIGTIAWDTSYLYVCIASNTWKRVAIATW